MNDHIDGSPDAEGKDFVYQAPTDVVYEREAPVRKGRFGATSIVTTSLLIAGGLLGGTAFALTNAPMQPKVSVPQVQTTDSTTSSTDDSASASTATADPSASSDSNATAATPDSSGKAPGKTIAVPPATFDDKSGERDFHPAPGSAPVPTAGSTAAPVFGGGEHDGGDHNKFRQPRPGQTGAPSFNNSDDSNEND